MKEKESIIMFTEWQLQEEAQKGEQVSVSV
jgi:hypothetical protein